MSNTTLTLQSITNLAATHVELMPLAGVGGYANEPALSLCNDTLTDLMASPNAWKFNQNALPVFVTAIYRQSYFFGGSVAFTAAAGGAGIALKTASTPGVVLSGNVVTVNTLEAHNFAIGDTVYMLGNVDAAFNSTYSQTPTGSGYTGGWIIATTPTLTSFTFALVAANTTSGAPGIYNWGWNETATMRDVNSNAPVPRVFQLEAVNNLNKTSAAGQAEKITVVSDNGDGTLKIRLDKPADTRIFAVELIFQAQPPLKTALTDTWTPFPDQYAFVYRQGFLARAYRFINSPRAEVEYQKLQAAIEKALGRDDAESSDQRIYPSQSLMGMSDGTYDEF